MNPKDHFVTNIYYLPDDQRINQRNLYVAIAPHTYNTRALGGSMQMKENIILIYCQGKLIQPRDPTLVLVGQDLFDPSEPHNTDKIQYLDLLVNGVLNSQSPEYLHDLPDFFHSHQPQKFHEMLTSILANSGIQPYIHSNLSEIEYAIDGFNMRVQNKSRKIASNSNANDLAQYDLMKIINHLVQPDIVSLIERVNKHVVKHYELWRDILDLIDGKLGNYFEPTLEFIGGPNSFKLYEVKEKTNNHLK